ncbi:bifunctional precorrin-2 dehydrogenase/sirohydrochlorin ferrochelatase [Candidatus Aminicenantes bacterium AC-708-M15]|nr:bifunctional precorrin-2 dehydrogenase/sirohydrochlorin ferrochelatase [SCandidatus Aminicenantes bacterium Aminicenantia_JdfR_composite]MCP2598599.1 bifunctional precorrin-2 dehydrogenase/sirohydrochlorin ferrochelatase [Candidatus Aminicenantes bacterium AC-335-L06]MCP2604342.1 bifunctional precorrin-2 dehydrogenase/sirohydrochlorin ferrochelatase [Candidatus Aminicenantes bacterium AC-708-M15]
MNILYPIFLKLNKKKCVVIGGGKTATRKVKALLEAKAKVTVISPKLTKELEMLAENGSIKVIKREYKEGDLDKYFLVFATTNSEEINKKVIKEAKKRKILCNIVDDPSNCDFYVPSVYTQGDLKIAISTNGKSPALARKIREELANIYGKEVALFLNLLGSLRKKIKAKFPDEEKRREIFSKIVNSQSLFSLKNKTLDEIKKEIKKWI